MHRDAVIPTFMLSTGTEITQPRLGKLWRSRWSRRRSR
jgi:hypothetical protein